MEGAIEDLEEEEEGFTTTLIEKAYQLPISTENAEVVGIDASGCVHVLGPKYKDLYAVSEREVDGVTEEYCTVSVGPHGATEEIEVIIEKTLTRGEIYQQMRRVITELRSCEDSASRNLLRNAKKFVRDCEDDATLDRHRIPIVAAPPTD